MEEKSRDWKKKSIETTHTLEETLARYNKQQSKLESLKNIAERYDGYGNSIRKVMEQKEQNRGLLGVVSDLIQVEKSMKQPSRLHWVEISRILSQRMKRLPRK